MCIANQVFNLKSSTDPVIFKWSTPLSFFVTFLFNRKACIGSVISQMPWTSWVYTCILAQASGGRTWSSLRSPCGGPGHCQPPHWGRTVAGAGATEAGSHGALHLCVQGVHGDHAPKCSIHGEIPHLGKQIWARMSERVKAANIVREKMRSPRRPSELLWNISNCNQNERKGKYF